MGTKKNVRKIGNSVALMISEEILNFLNLDPEKVKYKLAQDETGAVFVVILGKDVMALDEKKFLKHRNAYNIIIPKPLCVMWNIGLNEGQNRELELSFDSSPLKWRLSPT